MNECAICPWILPALAGAVVVCLGVWFWRSRNERIARIDRKQ